MSSAPLGEGQISLRHLVEPRTANPVLVCGLPGSGYVGKLAVDHLVSIFKAERMTEFYAGSFPPHVNVRDDGVARPVRGELYHCDTGQGNDLLVFTADAQPTTSGGEYQLSDSVLKEADRYGVKTVISLAAYITGGFGKERRVFGTSTSSDRLARLTESGVQVMSEGGITGMNGVMIGMAKLHGMEGICLLGETSGYLIDPRASQLVLEALGKVLGIRIDLGSLVEKARETEQIIGQIQRMTENQETARPGRPQGQPGYIG